MKRALAITLTIAMIGSLLFMGAAGSVAAQEDPDNNETDDDLLDEDFFDQAIGDLTAEQSQDLTTGDASVDVSVDQENNNAQVGTATAGDAVALSDGGGGAAAAADAPKSHGSAGAAGVADGAGAGAAAFSVADVTQAQEVAQTNAANVENVTAQSGDIDATQDIVQEPAQDQNIGDNATVVIGDDVDDLEPAEPVEDPDDDDGNGDGQVVCFAEGPGNLDSGPYDSPEEAQAFIDDLPGESGDQWEVNCIGEDTNPEA